MVAPVLQIFLTVNVAMNTIFITELGTIWMARRSRAVKRIGGCGDV